MTILISISPNLISVPLLQKQARSKKLNAASKKISASKKQKDVESESSYSGSDTQMEQVSDFIIYEKVYMCYIFFCLTLLFIICFG
jgi:hypothetical protein